MPTAVVDTNLVVSGLLTRRGVPFRLLRLWAEGAFQGVVSIELLAEYFQVITRPKLRNHFSVSDEEVTALMTAITRSSTFVTLPRSYGFGLRDPKDEMVLATAIAGKADVIVSGDRDIREFAPIDDPALPRILSASQFLALLGEPDGSSDRG